MSIFHLNLKTPDETTLENDTLIYVLNFMCNSMQLLIFDFVVNLAEYMRYETRYTFILHGYRCSCVVNFKLFEKFECMCQLF